MRGRERVGDAELRLDDNGAMNGGPEPEDVSVPPERSPLAGEGEVVDVALPWIDRALRYVRRPVGPPRPKLSNAVPAFNATNYHQL